MDYPPEGEKVVVMVVVVDWDKSTKQGEKRRGKKRKKGEALVNP